MENFNEEEFIQPRKFSDSRHFVKIFEPTIIRLPELTGAEVKVLLYLGFNTDFNKVRIALDSDFWKKVLRDTEYSVDYFKKILRGLRKKQFIYFDKDYLYVSAKYASRRR